MAVNPIKHMKNTTLSAEGFESTYALIVRSEEKERNLFEGAVYLVLILSAIVSIWHVAHQPVTFVRTSASAPIAQTADTNQRA
jgi:hypothetical protein